MVVTAKKTLKKKPVAGKTVTARRTAPARKRSTTEENRKAAAGTRRALVNRLKRDLKKARDAARVELKLVNAAARNEIAVLRDQLAAALKREEELRKISEIKLRKMLATGERWEKVQMERLKKAADEARRKMKK